MANQPSTADYRKYPKGPNFGLIVGLACVAGLLCLLLAYFVIRGQGRHIVPLQRTQNQVAAVALHA